MAQFDTSTQNNAQLAPQSLPVSTGTPLQMRPFATPQETQDQSQEKPEDRIQELGHRLENISFAPRPQVDVIARKWEGIRAKYQAKLAIGAAGDKYEQEADRVAEQVVQKINTPESVQRDSEKKVSSSIQRYDLGEEGDEELQMKPLLKSIQRYDLGEEGDEELQMKPLLKSIQREAMPEEEDPLQMKPAISKIQRKQIRTTQLQRMGESAGEASSDIESSINNAKGSGQKLPNQLRRKMESAMGADFSGVNIHTDANADVLNRSLNARAFTTGQDIFFKQGEYNPNSTEGQKLIAHESTHTIQQGAVPALQTKLQSNLPEVPSIQLEDDDVTTTETTTRTGTSDPTETSSKTVAVGEGTVTTTEKSTSVFVGAEKSMKTVSESSPETLKKAFEGLARAGVFGEASAKKQVETTSGVTATMEGKASGMVGAESKLSSEVIVTMEALTAMFEASAKAGFGGDLEGALTAVGGPFALELKGKIGAFVGIWAEAKGSLNLTRTSIALEGSAKVGVGAKSEGEVTVGVSVADLGIEGGGSYEAIAGAEAGVEGKFSIGLTGIEASGKAEAFAGAKVKAEGAASLKYKGKVLFKISAEASASAGVGGEIEGEFSFNNGKLVLGGKLGAALGLGLGGGATVEIDFVEIGEAIVDLVKRAFTKKALDNRATGDQDREQMPAEQQAQMIDTLYTGLFPHLQAYAKEKEKRQSQGKAKHYVKRECVQKLIDNRIRKKSPYKELVPYIESDIALRQAIRDAVGPRLQYIDIQEGVIRAFDVK